MSLLCKTDLTEYARQCTLQRRRYEACVQATQKDGMNQSTVAVACSTVEVTEALVESCEFDQGVEQNQGVEQITQGCVGDLLGLSVEPLVWEDHQATSHDATNETIEPYQWHRDRSQSAPQHVARSTRSNVNSVSYGAP